MTGSAGWPSATSRRPRTSHRRPAHGQRRPAAGGRLGGAHPGDPCPSRRAPGQQRAGRHRPPVAGTLGEVRGDRRRRLRRCCSTPRSSPSRPASRWTRPATCTPEDVIRELWEDHFVLGPHRAAAPVGRRPSPTRFDCPARGGAAGAPAPAVATPSRATRRAALVFRSRRRGRAGDDGPDRGGRGARGAPAPTRPRLAGDRRAR